MAEQKYRQGLLGWLTGFDPNNPTAPRKPALSPASTNGRGGVNRPPAKPAAPTAASPPAATRTAYDYFGKPATSGAPFNPSGKRSVIKSGPDPLSANPTKRNVSLQVAAGRSQAKGVPEPAKNSRPAPGRPPGMPASRKSPEAAAKQVVANAAASGTPKAKPTPAPKQSWWDKFSDDHKLSAAKSYADYKKLMESM